MYILLIIFILISMTKEITLLKLNKSRPIFRSFLIMNIRIKARVILKGFTTIIIFKNSFKFREFSNIRHSVNFYCIH